MNDSSDYARQGYRDPCSAVNHVVHEGDESPPNGYMRRVATLPADKLSSRVELGKILRAVRDEANDGKGLSQEALAALLGETQSWISRMEKGLNPIEIPKMVAWFAACGHQVALQWGEPAAVVDPLEGVPDEDRALLVKAAPLLTTAPTARKRLAFEVEMWNEEARAAAVTATVASVASQIGSVLTGKDADALRLLQERVGQLPAAQDVPSGTRVKSK